MDDSIDDSDTSLETLYTTIVNSSLGAPDLESSQVTSENSETPNNNTTANMAMGKPPKPLVVNSEIDMAQEWTEWVECYEHYFTSNELSQKSADVQSSNFLSAIGRDALRIVNNLGLSAAEKKNITVLKEKLTKHFAPDKNKTYERCQFHRINQKEGEPFEDFLQKLRLQVKKCGYASNADEFVMDQIVVGLKADTTRQKLWTEDELDLTKTLKICRAAERASKEINEINNFGQTSAAVNMVKKEKMFNCKWCDTVHGPRACPAFGKKCRKCNKKGHFESCCPEGKNKSEKKSGEKAQNKKKKSKKKSKKVHAVDDSSDSESSESDDEFDYTVSSIALKDYKVNAVNENNWSETLKVSNGSFAVKLDTGAQCNVLSKKIADKLKLKINKSRTKRIIAYNNEAIPVVGEVECVCESRKGTAVVVFKIVDAKLAPILGREMCEQMGFIVRVDSVSAESKPHRIGCYKRFKYDIEFEDDAVFKIIPARKIPYAVKDKVKHEIDAMVEMGIIEKITEPSPAVSPIVIVKKENKIRICLDPTELNKYVKRRHYPLKTVEEVAANIRDSKFFSKLDCEKGFWQVEVTERTSKYLSFATPWGRYKYLRLPFGISSAPEIFSEIMNKILEGMSNVEIAMDDILIHAESRKELERLTERVLRKLNEAGLTLNLNKCEFNKQRIKFLGHVFTSEGYEVDPEKVSVINGLNVPSNVKQLQRVLGMVTYVAKFIENMAEVTEPLRKLLQKDAAWYWDTEHQQSFERIKKMLTTTPILKYYDVNKPVKLSVDASSTCLGACLMQENQPIAYASKALSKSQQNYAQIEKEALAIKFGCTKFHEYIVGKKLEVESDHKPLETIFKKQLNAAPLRLQRILWDVVQYAPKVIYVKGTKIPIADALSRDITNPEEATDDFKSKEEYMVLSMFSVDTNTQNHLIKMTDEDSELQLLKAVVLRGWPEETNKLPECIRKYANFKEEIIYDEGLLFKGPKLIVPKAELPEMLKQLHNGHIGVESMQKRARHSLYWHGQSGNIKNFVETCAICQQTQRANVSEPLLQKVIPTYPFQNVSSDLFSCKGQDYLLIADHYSGFVDFCKLNGATSAEVIHQLKKWFAVHGVPEKFESDGGPQYMSAKFAEFSATWGFNHQVSSPRYPKSNGFAERMVQTSKSIIKKCSMDGSDVYMALLMLRNTPRNDVLKSPAQRLFSRSTRTPIPVKREQLMPKIVTGVTDELARLRLIQKQYADRISKPAQKLFIGDKVRLQTGHREWVGAEVVGETPHPRSVMVETDNGSRYRRNTHHLCKTKANIRSPHLDLEIQGSGGNVERETPPETVSNSDELAEPPQPQPSTTRANGKEGRFKGSSNSTKQLSSGEPIITKSGRTVKNVNRYKPSMITKKKKS